MSARTNILFPIETINRELDFRLLLAAQCANKSKRVFIGHHDAIYALTKEIHGGLYVGKNIRPTPTPEEAGNNQRYKQLAEKNIKLVWLDEEGGIFWGQEDEWKWTMLQSIDPSRLARTDYLCAWGDVQRDYYRSVAPDRAERIQTTGHPRFDLYKPRYREYYDRDVTILREQYGDFVLINTNFHRAYTVQNLKKIFGTRAQLDPSGFDHGEAVARWHHLIHIFSEFVSLVSRLSREFPHLNFVVRPHPSENIKFYKNIFEMVDNVHVLHDGAVGPWLLASRAMIYDGCTTAIEAFFCGTPRINFKPLSDERFDCQLPNRFGVRCTNEEEVQEYLHRVLSASNEIDADKNDSVTQTAASLIENFRQDSFPLLAATILQAAEHQPRDSGSVLPRLIKQTQRTRQLQHIKARLRGKKSSQSENQSGLMDKFYGFDNVDVTAKMQSVQQILNKEVNYQVVSNELICVEGG